MSNIFDTVKVQRPKSNTFNLSYDHKWSGNPGKLYPTCIQEVIPGDYFKMSSELLVRFAPMLAPIMHRVDAYTHYFFVPNRILWQNWENYITGGNGDLNNDPNDPPAHPFIDYDPAIAVGKLADYFGCPTANQGNNPEEVTGVNALPFAAYQKIWNDFYRDENLMDISEGGLANPPYLLVDGDNTPQEPALRELRWRSWRHDYFTGALPFAQKGDDVTLPLLQAQQDMAVWQNPAVGSIEGVGRVDLDTQYGSTTDVILPGVSADSGDIPASQLYVAGEQVNTAAATINDLRRAFRLQEWLEKNARGGTRYIENILVHFGVKSSDKRLQRAEYISGYKQPVVISEVLQSAPPTEGTETPIASMFGHGISAGGSRKVAKYYAEEHGWIIGMTSIIPRAAYQQGLPRQFYKRDRFEYFWPTFAHIGEQEVLKQELYYDTTDGENREVFGYVPRYAEYRYNPSRVSGQFKNTLSYWHWGRIFATRPELNEDFVVCDPGYRIFAVTDPDVHHLWCHTYNNIYARRPIPEFGTPTL